MKKRSYAKMILALVLAMVMLFALAACGSNGGKEEAGEKTGVLKIGSIAHQTGWFASIDLNNAYELQCYVDIINEEGGVKIGDTTYTIDLTIADAQSDAQGVRNAATLLVDEGCEYVVETNDFWVVNCQDIFEDEGVFHINGYCCMDPDYMGPDNPLAFTGANGTYGDLRTGVQLLTEYYPECKSIVFVNDDNGTQDTQQALMEQLGEEFGLEVKEYVIFPTDQVDYSSIAAKIKASGADAWLSPSTVDTIGSILKELRNSGSDSVCVATIGKPGEILKTICGEDAADRAFTLGNSLKDEDNTEIWSKLYKRVVEDYGEEVAASFTGNFANCLHQVLDVMQKCGSTDVQTVVEAWEGMEKVDTIYGDGYLGGAEIYGSPKHAVANATPYCFLKEGEVEFGGWLTDIRIP